MTGTPLAGENKLVICKHGRGFNLGRQNKQVQLVVGEGLEAGTARVDSKCDVLTIRPSCTSPPPLPTPSSHPLPRHEQVNSGFSRKNLCCWDATPGSPKVRHVHHSATLGSVKRTK